MWIVQQLYMVLHARILTDVKHLHHPLGLGIKRHLLLILWKSRYVGGARYE